MNLYNPINNSKTYICAHCNNQSDEYIKLSMTRNGAELSKNSLGVPHLNFLNRFLNCGYKNCIFVIFLANFHQKFFQFDFMGVLYASNQLHTLKTLENASLAQNSEKSQKFIFWV